MPLVLQTEIKAPLGVDPCATVRVALNLGLKKNPLIQTEERAAGVLKCTCAQWVVVSVLVSKLISVFRSHDHGGEQAVVGTRLLELPP